MGLDGKEPVKMTLFDRFRTLARNESGGIAVYTAFFAIFAIFLTLINAFSHGALAKLVFGQKARPVLVAVGQHHEGFEGDAGFWGDERAAGKDAVTDRGPGSNPRRLARPPRVGPILGATRIDPS